MDNKCPKCNGKLRVFYMKQECPYCGCDLLNYNLEKRLEEDSIKAEAEFEFLDKILNKIKGKILNIFSVFKRK